MSEGTYKGDAVAIKRLKMGEGDFDRIFKVLLMNFADPRPLALNFCPALLPRGYHLETFIPSEHFALARGLYLHEHTLLAHTH